MSSRLQIDQVEVAVIAVLQATLQESFGSGVDVDSIGDRDFNENGELILSPPCVRVRFGGADYSTQRDNQKLTYGAGILFDCFVYAENLRSKLDQRRDTLKLVSCVQDAVAGARFQLADGAWTDPSDMVSALPVMEEGSIVDQYYDVTFRVNGLAQFSGANANFGAR